MACATASSMVPSKTSTRPGANLEFPFGNLELVTPAHSRGDGGIDVAFVMEAVLRKVSMM